MARELQLSFFLIFLFLSVRGLEIGEIAEGGSESKLNERRGNKLWSPHNTGLPHFEEEEEEREMLKGPLNSAGLTPEPPPISAIRHHRSRKSFVRVRKPQISTKSEIPPSPSVEEEEVQGDEPITNDPDNQERIQVSQPGQNDSSVVYGRPFITGGRERNRNLSSTNVQKIKTLLSSPISTTISSINANSEGRTMGSTRGPRNNSTPRPKTSRIKERRTRKPKGIPSESSNIKNPPVSFANVSEDESSVRDRRRQDRVANGTFDIEPVVENTNAFPSAPSVRNFSEDGENQERFNPSFVNEDNGDKMTKFLHIVEKQHLHGANCTPGTNFTLGEGVVDRYAQERFKLEAEVAVNRANMLTRLWKNSPEVMESEYLLHASLFSMIEFDDDIFAAGNCYDKNEYKNYTLFCPFAYRLPEGSILVKDLAVEYKYLTNSSEWFYIARKNAEKVIKSGTQISTGYNSYTFNESAHTERHIDEILNVTYEDGKWSKPYFDCGGGNIWMMTYTCPFFGFRDGSYYFKGTSGIDIDLRRVDIDQCPLPENSTALNIFAASDKCKNATTKCVHIKGLGFRRGSYRCECRAGFYFPNVTSPIKFYNGTLLEEEYEKKMQNETTLYDEQDRFVCLECKEGCDTCVDDRPCMIALNWLMRTPILALQCANIAMLPLIAVFTWKYSEVKVVRAASPVLLRFIVLGAFFIYCTILVMYPSPSIITCTLRVWLREIGFSLAYGALMLKTWRISVIFRVRSAKAVKITDLDLMKRLGIIVAMFTALLVIRTLVAPPASIIRFTSDDLKAWICKSDWWDHTFTFMEMSILLWGIRLCIVVRKAPSEFNESKFISLAIYNEFLLSLFLNISMLFLQSPANPDLLYIIFFCHVQLTMTLLLCLIFGSKAYMVFRGAGKSNGAGPEELRLPTSKFISKTRSSGQTGKISGQNSICGVHSSSASSAGLLDPNIPINSKLSEDVQEEFRRLYLQLEELKERNMRVGNRHLVAKITAMQEAADNIIGPSPNLKKPKTLSILSEESTEDENPHLAKVLASDVKREGEDESGLRHRKNSRSVNQLNRSSKSEEALSPLSPLTPSENEALPPSPPSLLDSSSCEKACRSDGDDDPQPDEEEIIEVALDAPVEENSIAETCLSNSPAKDSQKNVNHTSSASAKVDGNGKVVLDLDDKSRFTDEITV